MRIIQSILCLAPLIWIGVTALVVQAAGNSCTGTGVSGQTIICSGSCPNSSCLNPSNKNIQTGTDAAGNPIIHTAIHCGCSGAGWACCYLLQWTSEGAPGGTFSYFVQGDCISCGQPNTNCKRIGAGTWADSFEAQCMPPS